MRRFKRAEVRAWVLVTLLGWLTAGSVLAQELSTQQTNPPALNWYQINTPHFRLLYPQGFEVQAMKTANTLEHIRVPESATMGVRPRKISVILQNQSSVSNGFVTLAPRRTEFFAMPSQNNNFTGNNDWMNLLASHEYRHVVQYDRSITGFNKVFFYLFGQQALSGMANAAAPYWFWEGDAVATETAFTHSGRGRIPNFNLVMRTNLLEGRTFNYHKQYLRSYKNNIPDHYVLGYHMISYLRMRTGDPAIWEKIARHSWNVPFIPLRFSSSIHHETGLYVKDLYREMAKDLKTQWTSELDKLRLTSFEVINPRRSKAYTDYKYPQVLDDGQVVAQKSGIGDIEQLVVLNHGNARRIFVQGQINDASMLSSGGGAVVWNEFRYDPRWLMRTYSVIRKLDLVSGRVSTVSSHSRYAGAAISPSGKEVATIETNSSYQTRLVILSAENGGVIRQFENASNDFLSVPRWSEDGKTIYMLRLNGKGKTFTRVDTESGQVVDLLPPSDENLGSIVPSGQYVFYNSPYSGIDNIYALNANTGRRYQVTCSRYGAYNPAVSKDRTFIYYSNQGKDGMDIVRIPFDTTQWQSLDDIQRVTPRFASILEQQEGRPRLFDSIPSEQYPVRRYHRAAGMINPHSWGTYFANSYTQARFGVYSQDLLSTTSINAGYLYDLNEKTGSFQVGASYQGFYPILDFNTSYGNRTLKEDVFGRSVRIQWKEALTSGGIRIPLVLTRSKYFTDIEIGNSFGLTHISEFQNQVSQGGALVYTGPSRFVALDYTLNGVKQHYLLTDQLNTGNLKSNDLRISFSHVLKTSRRDFNPKFAQLIYFESLSTPYGGDFKGKLWVVRGLLFFPGLFKHHSLWLRGGYQSSPSSYQANSYSFRNLLYRPRGYSFPKDDSFTTIAGNYQFPVWYPDIAIGPLLNIQRIKANLFCDYGRGLGKTYLYDFPNSGVPNIFSRDHSYISNGVEITFDVNILRLLPQIELGVRMTHLNGSAYQNSGMVYEFLIGNIPF